PPKASTRILLSIQQQIKMPEKRVSDSDLEPAEQEYAAADPASSALANPDAGCGFPANPACLRKVLMDVSS
ncbi:MAG TPA: hypothetical protein VLA28_05300, partial [Afifellaceae bacterium]|nr:hypothetical protein [Afifellaceae bacterium]